MSCKFPINPSVKVGTNLISVCAASIVRLHFVTYLNSPDLTWVMSDVYVWSDVEPCLGIICASLPAVQPLVRSVMKIERLFCIRTHLHHGKPLSNGRTSNNSHILQKRCSNNSRASSNFVHVDSFDGKGELGFEQGNDEERLTTFITHIESEQSRQQRANLDELVGPGFIRVRHDVEISVK